VSVNAKELKILKTTLHTFFQRKKAGNWSTEWCYCLCE